jgi:dUTP pyrophosphatase
MTTIDKPNIKVFKTSDDAVIPSKAYEEDAGYDLTIISKIKDFNSKTSLYDTGIKIEIDEGYYTEIVPRSSISKSGYMLANSIGIIDNNYRGNLMIALTKICDDAPDIELPFKCCQLIIRKQISANLIEVDTYVFNNTKRDEGGFGSTSS